MFVIRKTLLLVAIILMLLPLGIPMAAQEATEVPPTGESPVDVVVTGEDTVTVTIEAPESGTVPAVLNLVAILLVALAGGGSFALVWERIRRNKEAKDTIERLAEGLSPTWQTTINRMLDVAEQVNKTATEVLQFAREVTDGKPNDPPPTG